MYSLYLSTHNPQHTCGGEPAAFTIWFSPASTGDPGTKCRSDSKLLSYLTLSLFFLKLHYFFIHFTHLYLPVLCVCAWEPCGSWIVRSVAWGFYPPGHLALFLVIFLKKSTACMCVCSKAHVWRSEDNLWESTLSFCHMDSRDPCSSSGLVASSLTHWAISQILFCLILL